MLVKKVCRKNTESKPKLGRFPSETRVRGRAERMWVPEGEWSHDSLDWGRMSGGGDRSGGEVNFYTTFFFDPLFFFF